MYYHFIDLCGTCCQAGIKSCVYCFMLLIIGWYTILPIALVLQFCGSIDDGHDAICNMELLSS